VEEYRLFHAKNFTFIGVEVEVQHPNFLKVGNIMTSSARIPCVFRFIWTCTLSASEHIREVIKSSAQFIPWGSYAQRGWVTVGYIPSSGRWPSPK